MGIGKIREIAKIITEDMVPKFRRVRINIHTAYQWGPGWTGNVALNARAFAYAIRQAFTSAGWNVVAPDIFCSALEAYSHGQYLYLHPMEITGYICEKSLEEVRNILLTVNKEIIYSVDEGTFYEGVYDITDSDVLRAFWNHKDEVWKIIKETVAKHPNATKESLVWNYLYPQAAIPRANKEGGLILSSSNIEYIYLLNEVDSIQRKEA